MHLSIPISPAVSFDFPLSGLPGAVVAETLGATSWPVSAPDKLDRMASIRDGIATLLDAKQRVIDSILSEYHNRLDAFDADVATLQAQYDSLDEDVRENVLSTGGSIKGRSLHAVFVSGKTSWDSKGLSAYSVACPAILAFRKIGQPSVSVREIKGGL